MYLTEEEAKDKACCKAMPHKISGQAFTAACLASGCLAWRWAINHTPLELQDLENPVPPIGSCGLAGKPEQ